MKAAEFRQRIERDGKLLAVKSVNPEVASDAEADAVIRIYIQRLLDSGNYIGAAMVLWGFRLFDPRPQSVQDVWRGINVSSKLLAQGGGALGKSYTIIAWLMLDWWRDPQYTAVKLISTTAGHAKANTFSTMTMLHKEAVVKMPGEVFAEHIGLETSDKRACISVVKIPQGDDGKGRLQGFHPIPRPKQHATLGWMSRVRVFIDEAEETPIGVWEGVDNMLTTIDDSGTIKIFGAYNPKNQGSKVAQLAEPLQGWEGINIETHFDWKTKASWHVIRLDAAQCENVKEKKIIYPGLQTYEGFRALATRRGGNTPEYYTFGRGWYPPSGAVNNIITPEWLTGCRGTFLFTGPTMKFAGVDIAVEGRDEAVLTVGRYGEAVLFTHETGRIINFNPPRMCAQVDQQIILDKGSTRIVAHAIRDNCKLLQVAPENLDCDRTGNGATVHDLMCEGEVWSPFVMGTDFNKAATDRKILEQDKETAEELYDGIVTEVWFALARWMEANYIAISPGVDRDRLNSELLGRKYKLKGKVYRVLSKDDMKLLMGTSPDFADSLTLFLNAIRKKTQAQASMTGKTKVNTPRPEPRHGIVDQVKFYEETSDV